MRILIRSMTGFGRGENTDSLRSFTVEIKSVNHRYNDIIVKMPKHLNYLEESIKKLIRNKVTRGRVEIYISLEYISQSDIEVKVDIPLATSYKKAIDVLCNELHIENNINIELLTRFPDVLKTQKREEDEDEIWACLKLAIEDSLNRLISMRIEEGKELANDIILKVKSIESMVKQIEERSPEVVLEYKTKLSNRIKELLEEKYEIDENKLANEVAYFADKCSINEEIVRLYSHINQMVKSLEADVPVGRKLDFLVQEMNREVNTIGSKVGDIDITNKVVDIKSELEKIREQIQNIE
ncbi:YicC/YloC family endoribonuclease [Brassicibacter mesophilus]|uniref:YicC/YloC family endoribonuclease n=1 Tax=Brassicibacter mesophilus TaxID=745119 RepID=UPI003D1F69A9